MAVRRSLYEKASRYRNLWLTDNMQQTDFFDANRKEHDLLTDALLKRDRDTACQLIEHHLLSPSKALLASQIIPDKTV
nr:FCD domain-containing protein [Aliamphritea spongicola]